MSRGPGPGASYLFDNRGHDEPLEVDLQASHEIDVVPVNPDNPFVRADRWGVPLRRLRRLPKWLRWWGKLTGTEKRRDW